MPLKKTKKGDSTAKRKKTAQENTKKLISEGYPPNQAAAIAYQQAKIKKKKK